MRKEATWITGDGETLAEYIPQDLFQGLLESRIAVPPDRAGILIRDGQIVDTFVGGHFSVGGLWSRLKETLGGKHALRMLVADLKPFRIDLDLQGKTRDHVPAAATVHAELQLDPERPANILGLVSDDATLTREDIRERLHPPLQTRVFEPAVGGHDAEELRGNLGLQDQVQADAIQVLEEQAADLGVLVRSVNVAWAWTPVEIEAMDRRMQELEDARRDFQVQRELRALERKKTGTVWTLRTKGDIDRVQAAEAHDLKMLLARQELELADVRDTATRLKAAQELEHRIRTEAAARRAALEAELETEQNALARTRIRQQILLEEGKTRALLQQMEIETRRLEQQLEREQADWALDNQLRKLGKLDEIDAARDHRKTEETIRLETARKEMELRFLELKAAMTPEQLLALQAGDSAHVAEIFARKMEVEGANQAEKERLLRELIDTERQARATQAEQARHMFDQPTDRLADVGMAAAGRPSDTGGSPPGPSRSAPERVRCPACGARVPRGALCNECGAPLDGT
jgi:hypothetical protein